MKKRGLIFSLILDIALLSAVVLGQGVPAPFTSRLQVFSPTGLATSLSRPILLRGAKDGSKRIFVVQQGGIIKVFQPGATTATDFINLSSKIIVPGSAGDERGLLGLAFHPQFASNGRFFVYYSRVGDGANTLAEYKTTTGTGTSNTGDITSERVLYSVPDPFSNHNGGMLEFGPDGFLYIGMGDGGSADDPGNRAQNRSLFLGKILRIDVNIPVGSSVPYLIPTTNPFTGAGTSRCDNGSPTSPAPADSVCQEIWAYGMRNPWRWSFDRARPNPMWVADVGQGSVEEVDVITTGGGNYGWRVYEGTSCTGNDPGLCTPANYTMPLFNYTHSGGRCSITGGYVYRGTLGSLPNGAYTYGDYCSGEVFIWNNGAQQLLHDTPRTVVSFGEDDDGEIYVCYGNGQIDKMVRAKASADLDGDLKTDVSLYRPSDENLYILHSSNNTFKIKRYGLPTDIITSEDYDGDNIVDPSVYRQSSGQWYVLRSTDDTVSVINFGSVEDIPAAGDYDGDAKADLALFRPSNGVWFISRSSDSNISITQFGLNGDKPVSGDYDGDGKYDIAVLRPSTNVWYRLNSLNGAFNAFQWGIANDVPTPGDWDGDGRIDISVFRPSNGTWYRNLSLTNTIQYTQFGLNNDTPTEGDYDGDGKDDIAVFRPSSGQWFVLQSTNSQVAVTQWGLQGDVPIPAFDNP